MKKEKEIEYDFFEELGIMSCLESLDKQVVGAKSFKALAKFTGDFHEFCSKVELIRTAYINDCMSKYNLNLIDKIAFNKALEPILPKCKYDKETEIFEMEMSFVPHLKFDTIKEFVKVKNALIYLIIESIKRMKEQPRYGEEAVLIIFTLYSPYLFDVDNIEIKYVIDAFRYSHFFRDDNLKYVSYLVEGNEDKTQPVMRVKIIKKSDIKIGN